MIYRLYYFTCSPLSAAFFRFFPLVSAVFGEQMANRLGVHKFNFMSIEITAKVSRNGLKKWYYYEWGKGRGERKAAGVFTYTKPRDPIQRNQ